MMKALKLPFGRLPCLFGLIRLLLFAFLLLRSQMLLGSLIFDASREYTCRNKRHCSSRCRQFDYLHTLILPVCTSRLQLQ